MSAGRAAAPDRASLLWLRFAGMFGGEALSRKFGDEPPPEWCAAIARLRDFELDRGLRRLAYSGRDALPGLPAFLRLCRSVHDATDDDMPRPPAGPPLPSTPQGDAWDAAAGRHLLGHVTRRAARGVHFASARARRACSASAPDAETRELTAPLVDAKTAWARAMREAEAAGTLPADGGAALWAERIAAAERTVAQVRARFAAMSPAPDAEGIAL